MVFGKLRFGSLIAICFLIGLGCSWDPMIRPASANQLGGFIKKRVKDAVKEPESDKNSGAISEQSGSNTNPRFNDRVLELNEETLAKLEKALLCEKSTRDEVEAKYAKMPTKEEYQTCSMDAMMSPEGQELVEKENSASDAQQYMKKLMALLEKKCGKNPENANKSEDLKPAEEKCAKEANLTPTQFSIAEERITPFCKSGGQEKVQGYGSMYFVYSPAEVNAIKPKCARFMELIHGKSEPK
jgi:hypothetical protein